VLADIGVKVTRPLRVMHVRDLEVFEGPLLSEYRDETGGTYIEKWCTRDENTHRTLLVRSDQCSIAEYLGGRLSLLDLLIDRSSNVGFLFDYGRDGVQRATIVEVSSLPANYLPTVKAHHDPTLRPRWAPMSQEVDDAGNKVEHMWLHYRAQHGNRQRARQIVVAWASYYSSGKLSSVSQLRKTPMINVMPTDPQSSKKWKSWRFDDLVDAIVQTCDFDVDTLGLPPINSKALPQDFHYSHNIPPTTDHTGTFQIKAVGSLGKDFPLVPTLDREGMIFTSFDGVLHGSVLLRGPRWFNNLRLLVNDVVSAVDIKLTYLYLLAEYAPKPGWRFDKAKLGERHGRRMEDKLRWVEAITGRQLNAPQARGAFKELRELRNHLNHFDPPCLAYSVDDVARWLNLVPMVGELLWEIQRCMDEPLSRDLVRWLLLLPVAVVPRDQTRPRPAQLSTAGYASTRW
jgi:hypothetical protein